MKVLEFMSVFADDDVDVVNRESFILSFEGLGFFSISPHCSITYK